jgi:hypothetical protein
MSNRTQHDGKSYQSILLVQGKPGGVKKQGRKEQEDGEGKKLPLTVEFSALRIRG